jgi:hypothetical protein
LNLDFGCYRLHQIGLQCQDVRHVALVAVCPKMPILPRINELSCEPQAISGAHHRDLNDSVYSQLLRDLRHGLVCPSVVHRRGARDDLDRLDLREAGNQGIGHTICKEILRGIGREILYGKHRQRFNRPRCHARSQIPGAKPRKRNHDAGCDHGPFPSSG